MLHFYEGQVRKFVTQFIRVLSNFSIEMGKGKNGEVNLRQVPVIYGDMTRQVANIIKNITKLQGKIVWDTSKPDGTKRKLIDSSRINNLGWEHKYELVNGISKVYNWYQNNIN